MCPRWSDYQPRLVGQSAAQDSSIAHGKKKGLLYVSIALALLQSHSLGQQHVVRNVPCTPVSRSLTKMIFVLMVDALVPCLQKSVFLHIHKIFFARLQKNDDFLPQREKENKETIFLAQLLERTCPVIQEKIG
jgi:hypothetical protein